MGPIDRFTRDERSAVVWWPFALLLIVLCIATIPGEHRAVDAERSAAQTRSVAYLQELASSVGSADLSAPLNGDTVDATRATLRREVLVDTRVSAVRLWTPEGTLLFSTVTGDAVGSGEALNDSQIRDASADQGAPVSVVSDRTLAGTSGPTTFRTYLGLVGTPRPVVGEVELSDAVLLSSVHAAWLGYRILFGIAALLVVGLALLSIREPAARIGAGVPFYETSIPRGYALVDLDQQAQVEQTGAHARTRVAHVEAKLRESEEARRKAEGQLQRALSAIATRMGPTGIESVFPRPASSQPAESEPPVTRRSTRPKVAKAPMLEPEPVVAAPPAPVAKTPKPEPIVVPEPEPVAVPEPVVALEPEPVAVRAPEPIVAAEPEPPHAESATPEPVLQVPEVDRAFVLRVPDVPPGEDESAVDVLERLVERVPVPSSDVDPSVVRARLARLAASKKPRSRSDEPLGDARRGSDS